MLSQSVFRCLFHNQVWSSATGDGMERGVQCCCIKCIQKHKMHICPLCYCLFFPPVSIMHLQVYLFTTYVYSTEIKSTNILLFLSGGWYVYQQRNEVHNNCGIEIYYQTDMQTTHDNMLLELFCQIISEPCFNTLRTKEQLGEPTKHEHRMSIVRFNTVFNTLWQFCYVLVVNIYSGIFVLRIMQLSA